ncbi:MAG: hypothetical protein QOJ99_1067 [Bryobacterales bacterium]|nr:hypothetical protein [Bryobacterales bacterium]
MLSYFDHRRDGDMAKIGRTGFDGHEQAITRCFFANLDWSGLLQLALSGRNPLPEGGAGNPDRDRLSRVGLVKNLSCFQGN